MEKLGIELPLLLTQVVNFLVMILILTKLLYKPILKSLQARQKKIEEGLKASEKAMAEAEKLALKKDEMLGETRDEARVILENAKKEAKRLKEEITSDGRAEVAQMKLKLEKEMQARYTELKAQISAHTVEIAAEMAKRAISDVLSDQAQHELITKRLKKIEKIHEKRE